MSAAGLDSRSPRESDRSAPATAASGSTTSREGATMTTRTPDRAAPWAAVRADPQVASGEAGRTRTRSNGASVRTSGSRSAGPGAV